MQSVRCSNGEVDSFKLDAARAQIDAAIEIYFVVDNPIAFHTLTAAAYNILRDLALKEGSAHPFIKTSLLTNIR